MIQKTKIILITLFILLVSTNYLFSHPPTGKDCADGCVQGADACVTEETCDILFYAIIPLLEETIPKYYESDNMPQYQFRNSWIWFIYGKYSR